MCTHEINTRIRIMSIFITPKISLCPFVISPYCPTSSVWPHPQAITDLLSVVKD